jgi:hypothetical protein
MDGSNASIDMGAMRPSTYRWANNWMIGMGSSHFQRNGSMFFWRQHFSQRTQCASAVLAHLAVTPAWILFCTRHISAWNASLFGAGTVIKALSEENGNLNLTTGWSQSSETYEKNSRP